MTTIVYNQGYSGSPVIDEASGSVLGVVSHRQDEGKKGIAISIEALKKIWLEMPSDLFVKSTSQTDRDNQHHQDQKCIQIVGERPPHVVNYFKDRQKKLEKIGRLLADRSTRLVSVTGRGGMGKTALISKVLQDLEHNRWPHTNDKIPVDGIVYLSTRTTGISLERLFLDCAKMLGGEQKKMLTSIWTNPQMKTRDKVTRLLELIKDGLYIILMDNMEDIIDDHGQIVDGELRIFFDRCLTAPNNILLLVTSRIKLSFPPELLRFDHRVELEKGLPAPDGVALLRELDPNGDSGLRDASEELLMEAVDNVQGIPRGIELIAAILANDQLTRLEDMLQKELFHHKDVIDHLIKENYQRLDEGSCRVMDALAMFKCPIQTSAISYLLKPFTSGLNIPDILQNLIRTYIVKANRDKRTVTLHPLDQDYIYSQLLECDANESTYTRKRLELRAVQYYRSQRKPAAEWKSIDDLEPQLKEFEHLVKAGEYNTAAQLINNVDSGYLSVWSHYRRLLSMRIQLLSRIMDKRLEMNNLNSLGLICRYLGQYDRAIEYHQQAITINNDVRDKIGECISLRGLGHSYSLMGQHEHAIRYLQNAITAAHKIGDRHTECVALDRMGVVCRNQGHLEKSIDYCQKALTIARKIGDPQSEGSILENLGITYRNLRDLDKSIEYFQQTLVIAHKIADRNMEGRTLTNFGYSYICLGRLTEATDYLQQALAITREIFDRRFEGWALEAMGRVYLNQNRIDEAIKNLEQALIIHKEIDNRNGERQAHAGLAEIYLRMNNYTKVTDHLLQALFIARELDNRREEGRHLNNLGNAYLQQGKYEQAIEHYQKAYTVFEIIGMKDAVKQVSNLITKTRSYQLASYHNKNEKHG